MGRDRSKRRSSEAPRAHHYIPRFHLGGFAPWSPNAAAPMIHRYDKRSATITRLSVARAAVVNDFYTLPPELNAWQPDALEHVFASHERIVAPIFRQLREFPPGEGRVALTATARDAMAGYIALLRVRSPGARDLTARRMALEMTIVVDRAMSNPDAFERVARWSGSAATREELEPIRLKRLEELRSGEVYFEAPAIKSLEPMGQALDEVRPKLVRRRWVLVRSGRWPHFVIGDQPIAIIDDAGEPSLLTFDDADHDVLMPIGSHWLLAIASGEPGNGVEITEFDPVIDGLTAPWWHLANAASWRAAERFVFGRSEADLRAVELALDPAIRSQPPARPTLVATDPAWAIYAERLGIPVIHVDDASPGVGPESA